MSTSRGRLRWRCRRGLKELDVFLEAFVTHGLDSLDEAQLSTLEGILEMQDRDILAGLLGDDEVLRAQGGEPAVAVAELIRGSLRNAGTRS